MTRVFISYSRLDGEAVLPFVDRLRAAGFAVWIDQASIHAAVPWRQEIIKAIRTSDLVIAMQSPAWHRSASCADELAITRGYNKAVLYVDITDRSTNWLAAVKAADAQVGTDERILAGLLGDSYRWSQAGRVGAHLASGEVLRAYRRIVRLTGDGHAREFVRRSWQRARRRRLAAAVLGVVTAALVVGATFMPRLSTALETQIEAATADANAERLVSAAIQRSPVQGLQAAVELAAVDDTWATRSGLALSLRAQLPDTVENPPAASPAPAPGLEVGTQLAHGDSSLVVVSGGIRVEAPESSLLTRIGGSVSALAWGPDGTRFAVATNEGVRVIQVSTGREMAMLRGFDGALEQLEWTGDNTLAGSFGATTVVWHLQTPALENTGWPVRSLVQGPDGTVLAIGPTGQLALIDDSGVRYLPDLAGVGTTTVPTATPTASGWLVTVGGEDSGGRLLELSVSGELGHSVELADCYPSSIALAGSEVYVSCVLNDVAAVDLGSWTVRRLPVDAFQIDSLLVDTDGMLLDTSVYSELYRWSGSSWTIVGLWQSSCPSGASILAAQASGDRILVTGAGARYCTHLRNDPEDRASRNTLVVPSGIETIRDAVWSADGRTIAAVAASGELWIFDAEHYVTRSVTVPTGTELLSVEFLDEHTVLVGSKDGNLVVVDVSLAVADLQGQLEEAQLRLQQAAAWGIR